MKKLFTISILVVIVSLLAAASAFAKHGKGNIKGEVTTIDPAARNLTILTKKGETVLVNVPADFDFTSVNIGDWVLVKGKNWVENSIVAEWIKPVGKDSIKNDVDKSEGSKDNSAFCADDKQVKPHPLSVKIAERYGASEEWVMGYFCDGYGMGAIMLALKTSMVNGADPADLLDARAEGKGWGQIWKDLGIIGSEKEGHSPPGLLNKHNHAGPKNKIK